VLNDGEVVITVNTGAESTLVRHGVYFNLKESERPDLIRSVPPVGHDGTAMKHYGQAIFSIKMGPVVLERKMTVENMHDEVLFGADILRAGGCS
jgi:hypothetical protein